MYMELNLVLEPPGLKVLEYEKNVLKMETDLSYPRKKKPPNENFNAKFGIGASLKKEEAHGHLI